MAAVQLKKKTTKVAKSTNPKLEVYVYDGYVLLTNILTDSGDGKTWKAIMAGPGSKIMERSSDDENITLNARFGAIVQSTTLSTDLGILLRRTRAYINDQSGITRRSRSTMPETP